MQHTDIYISPISSSGNFLFSSKTIAWVARIIIGGHEFVIQKPDKPQLLKALREFLEESPTETLQLV